MNTIKTYLHANYWQILAYASFFFILFGVKLWTIFSYGNATPFWDQWGVEATEVFKPCLDGTFVWIHLFDLHNEHRFLTTRLLSLVLLNLNGLWNPLLEMVVNALIHVTACVLSVVLLMRVVGRGQILLLLFSIFLFAIPFGWENALWGMEEDVYFAILFSILCQWFVINKNPFSLPWWCGLFFGMLAYLSWGLGIFALASCSIVGFIFFLFGLRKTKEQILSAIFLTVIFIIGVCQTPNLERSSSIRASNFFQFIHSLMQILAWPLPGNYFFAFFRNLPALIFVFYLLWKKPLVGDKIWFLFGMVLLFFGQAMSIAYGRGAGYSLASRYLDVFVVAIMLNFACLIYLRTNKFLMVRVFLNIIKLLWIVILVIFLISLAEKTPAQLKNKKRSSIIQEFNTKNYLATGNLDYLKKPLFDIPYVTFKALALRLNSLEIRSILPANISLPLVSSSFESKPLDSFVQGGYCPSVPKQIETVWGNIKPGEAWIRFGPNKLSHLLAIPVEGYPLSRDNHIEVLQNGHRIPLIIKENPLETWRKFYVKVDKGPFVVHMTALNPNYCLAVGAPRNVGIYDGFIDALLAHWYIFILFGFVGSVFLITLKVLKWFGN